MKMRQFKNKFNLMLTALSVVALIFASSCGSDDPTPSLSIAFDGASASAAEGGGDVTITVSFAAAPTAVTVTANVSGTAVYDTDYTTTPAVSGNAISLSIAEGATSATITFSPIDNNASDGNRTVILTLAAATGVELGTTSEYTMTISDDDIAGANSIVEDFEGSGQADNDDFMMTDWINHLAAGEERVWTLQEFGGNKYVEFTAFSSGDASNIAWLVLPKVNFDGLAVANMSFQNQIGFGDDNTKFQLYSSTDFDGSSDGIATATWDELSFTVATEDNVWISSGDVDLSGLSGNGYLAFRYEGNTQGDNDASYRIDHINVGGATPAMTVGGTLADFGSVDNGANSAEQSFTLTGTGVIGDVAVSASDNFEVSTTSGSGFSSSVTLADVSTEQRVYVRFSPTTGFNGVINGSIGIGSNAITADLDVTGTESGNVSTNVFIEEDFDYGSTAGDLTTITTNWTAHSGSTTVGYVTSGLSMTGYASSGVGGAATITGSNSEDVNRIFPDQTSGVIYGSTLVSLTAIPTGENYFFHFKDVGFGLTGRVHAKDDGANGVNFGISEGSTSSSTLNFGTGSYALNTTYLIVIKYDFSAGEASLYVMDTPSATEPATATATSSDGSDATSILSIAFRQSGGIPDMTVDGVRVATDWAGIIGQ